MTKAQEKLKRLENDANAKYEVVIQLRPNKGTADYENAVAEYDKAAWEAATLRRWIAKRIVE